MFSTCVDLSCHSRIGHPRSVGGNKIEHLIRFAGGSPMGIQPSCLMMTTTATIVMSMSMIVKIMMAICFLVLYFLSMTLLIF